MKNLLVTIALFVACPVAFAGTVVWNFDGGLNPHFQSGASATLTPFNAGTASLTTFGTTTTFGIPNPTGGPANAMFMNYAGTPAASGYGVNFLSGFTPNGGSASYVNNYTFMADVFIPSPGNPGWLGFFNTNNTNTNDSDFFVSPAGALGISSLGYSANGLIAVNQWYRIAFQYDRTNNSRKYFINGVPVSSGAAGALDGTFSLYPLSNPGLDMILFGDNSSEHRSLYVSSALIADFTMTDSQIAALGGVSAMGLAPEPQRFALAILALLPLVLSRRRQQI